VLIDRFLPAYDWNEVHSIEIRAAPAAVLSALRAVTAAEMPLVGILMGVRRLPARILGSRAPARGGGPVLEEVLRSLFVLLAENESELVVGTVGRFWQARPAQSRIRDGDGFIAFDAPGWAKAAMDFRVAGAAEGGRTRLTTETRIAATDARARRRFAAYWLFVRPGSGLIRRLWLRAVKTRAEAGGDIVASVK
jgi:hypothetical protein